MCRSRGCHIWTSEAYRVLIKHLRWISLQKVNRSQVLPIVANQSILGLGESIRYAFEHLSALELAGVPLWNETKKNIYLVEIKISSVLNSSILLSSYSCKFYISTIGFIFKYITIFFFIFLYFHIFTITDFKNSWLDLILYVVVLNESKIKL